MNQKQSKAVQQKIMGKQLRQIYMARNIFPSKEDEDLQHWTMMIHAGLKRLFLKEAVKCNFFKQDPVRNAYFWFNHLKSHPICRSYMPPSSSITGFSDYISQIIQPLTNYGVVVMNKELKAEIKALEKHYKEALYNEFDGLRAPLSFVNQDDNEILAMFGSDVQDVYSPSGSLLLRMLREEMDNQRKVAIASHYYFPILRSTVIAQLSSLRFIDVHTFVVGVKIILHQSITPKDITSAEHESLLPHSYKIQRTKRLHLKSILYTLKIGPVVPQSATAILPQVLSTQIDVSSIINLSAQRQVSVVAQIQRDQMDADEDQPRQLAEDEVPHVIKLITDFLNAQGTVWTCPILFDKHKFDQLTLYNCGHYFSNNVISQLRGGSNLENRCPMCRHSNPQFKQVAVLVRDLHKQQKPPTPFDFDMDVQTIQWGTQATYTMQQALQDQQPRRPGPNPPNGGNNNNNGNNGSQNPNSNDQGQPPCGRNGQSSSGNSSQTTNAPNASSRPDDQMQSKPLSVEASCKTMLSQSNMILQLQNNEWVYSQEEEKQAYGSCQVTSQFDNQEQDYSANARLSQEERDYQFALALQKVMDQEIANEKDACSRLSETHSLKSKFGKLNVASDYKGSQFCNKSIGKRSRSNSFEDFQEALPIAQFSIQNLTEDAIYGGSKKRQTLTAQKEQIKEVSIERNSNPFSVAYESPDSVASGSRFIQVTKNGLNQTLRRSQRLFKDLFGATPK